MAIQWILGLNFAIILMQVFVLLFQPTIWYTIVGSIFSIMISLSGFMMIHSSSGPQSDLYHDGLGKLRLYSGLLFLDSLIQTVVLILLICLLWIVGQYCRASNESLGVQYFGYIACYDYWHFDYGEMNAQDKVTLITVIIGGIVFARFAQLVAILVSNSSQRRTNLMFRHETQGPASVEIRY